MLEWIYEFLNDCLALPHFFQQFLKCTQLFETLQNVYFIFNFRRDLILQESEEGERAGSLPQSEGEPSNLYFIMESNALSRRFCNISNIITYKICVSHYNLKPIIKKLIRVLPILILKLKLHIEFDRKNGKVFTHPFELQEKFQIFLEDICNLWDHMHDCDKLADTNLCE